MKRLIVLLLCVAIALAMTATAFATNISEGAGVENGYTPEKAENENAEKSRQGEIKIYIEEKIIPVVAGVITSIAALLGSLRGILKALGKLEGAKESFDFTSRELAEHTQRELQEIKGKYDGMKEGLGEIATLENQVLELKGEIEGLILQISNLSQIASLGFAKSKELIKDGRAREIAILAKENEVV